MARITCNFYSYSVGYPIDIQIILPSLSPCDGDVMPELTHKITEKYPVIYFLHGHGNDYLCWSRFTSIERYVEERRIAAVFCSVGNKAYMNAEYGENWFDLVEKELPEFVETNFPISDKKEDRYVAGLSMGGYGALVHGLKHPERFTAIGAFSPAVVMPQMAEENGGIALGHTIPPMIKAEDLVDDLLVKKAELPKIFLCIGHNDFLYESVEAFHQKLVNDGVEHRYDSVPGYEHEWAFWDLELPMFLDWIPRNDAYAKMDRRKM